MRKCLRLVCRIAVRRVSAGDMCDTLPHCARRRLDEMLSSIRSVRSVCSDDNQATDQVAIAVIVPTLEVSIAESRKHADRVRLRLSLPTVLAQVVPSKYQLQLSSLGVELLTPSWTAADTGSTVHFGLLLNPAAVTVYVSLARPIFYNKLVVSAPCTSINPI